MTTTQAGTLLKHQVAFRAFANWEESRPGFTDADLVAHCGASAHGAFLNKLVLTNIATGWTECLRLHYRCREAVIHALTLARQLLPFLLFGLDRDNGTEFLDAQLLEYCSDAKLPFTRARAYRTNDQCDVEQKNGAVLRLLAGYERYEGQRMDADPIGVISHEPTPPGGGSYLCGEATCGGEPRLAISTLTLSVGGESGGVTRLHENTEPRLQEVTSDV